MGKRESVFSVRRSHVWTLILEGDAYGHPLLVAMVLQEPSRVDLLAALSEDEASGSAQWPLAPVGPAQATLDVFRHAAETLGYVVPETLCVQAGQLFYHNGRLEEVRLAGVCAEARPGEHLWWETPWSTP